MMNWLIFLLLFFLTIPCKDKSGTSDVITIRPYVKIDSCGSNLSLRIDFHNNSSEVLSFSDPKCHQLNTMPHLYEEGIEVPINFILKVDPDCGLNRVVLAADSSYRFYYDYSLSQLFDLKPSRKYRLEVSYYGDIIAADTSLGRVSYTSSSISFICQ